MGKESFCGLESQQNINHYFVYSVARHAEQETTTRPVKFYYSYQSDYNQCSWDRKKMSNIFHWLNCNIFLVPVRMVLCMSLNT